MIVFSMHLAAKGPSSLAKLVYNYNNSVLYANTYLDGVINQLMTGGHHPVETQQF